MKEVCFQGHYINLSFCTLQAFAKPTDAVGRFVVVQQVVNTNLIASHAAFSVPSFIKIPVIHKLLYPRTDEDPFFYICIADPWKLVLQIPKTFSIPVHGLHSIFNQSNLDVEWRYNYFLWLYKWVICDVFCPERICLRRNHSVTA
jgi:hypothetical protein